MAGSNSEDKEIQIPGRITKLLKPVHNSPYSASPQTNWFLIIVIRTGPRRGRYFFDLSRSPRHLPKTLPVVYKSARNRGWHTIFFLTPKREFAKWLIHFPMLMILAKQGGFVLYPNMVGKPHHRRKIKKRKPTQLLRPLQLALTSPNEGLEQFFESPEPSDLPILQSPNQSDTEVESEYSESDFSGDE